MVVVVVGRRSWTRGGLSHQRHNRYLKLSVRAWAEGQGRRDKRVTTGRVGPGRCRLELIGRPHFHN